MEWQDRALVLSSRRHGERDAILEVMTPQHGRHLGLVRGGRSSRLAAALQPGNRIEVTWRARLEDHLGAFAVEMLEARAGAILSSALALHAVAHLALLLRLLPERSPHPHVYDAADGLCALTGEAMLLAQVLVRFELLILAELGFGLDLGQCAATGTQENLVYVSPKSGRAVSADAGAPWAPKLLTLPAFLADASMRETPALDPVRIAEGFVLSGYFLDRHVFEPRALPPSEPRATFIRDFMAFARRQ